MLLGWAHFSHATSSCLSPPRMCSHASPSRWLATAVGFIKLSPQAVYKTHSRRHRLALQVFFGGSLVFQTAIRVWQLLCCVVLCLVSPPWKRHLRCGLSLPTGVWLFPTNECLQFRFIALSTKHHLTVSHIRMSSVQVSPVCRLNIAWLFPTYGCLQFRLALFVA